MRGETKRTRPKQASKPPKQVFKDHEEDVRSELWKSISEKIPGLLAVPREEAAQAIARSLKPFRPLSAAELSELFKHAEAHPAMTPEEHARVKVIISEALACRLPEEQKKPDADALAKRLVSVAYYTLNVIVDDEDVVASMKSALGGCTRKDLALLADVIENVSRGCCLEREEVLRLRETAYTAVLGYDEAQSLVELHNILAELGIQPDRGFYNLLARRVKPSSAMLNVTSLVEAYGADAASSMIKSDPKSIGLAVRKTKGSKGRERASGD